MLPVKLVRVSHKEKKKSSKKEARGKRRIK